MESNNKFPNLLLGGELQHLDEDRLLELCVGEVAQGELSVEGEDTSSVAGGQGWRAMETMRHGPQASSLLQGCLEWC